MWTFFSVAIAISLLTYFADGNYSFSDNILNVTDLLMVVGVMVAILIWGDHTTRFNRFDLGCTIAVFSIIIFWIISNNHIITNYSVQAIMVISYFPVVTRMIQQQKNTEAFSIWIPSFMAPTLSLLAGEGFLASVYAVRGMLCAGTLLLLMWFFYFKTKKASQKL